MKNWTNETIEVFLTAFQESQTGRTEKVIAELEIPEFLKQVSTTPTIKKSIKTKKIKKKKTSNIPLIVANESIPVCEENINHNQMITNIPAIKVTEEIEEERNNEDTKIYPNNEPEINLNKTCENQVTDTKQPNEQSNISLETETQIEAELPATLTTSSISCTTVERLRPAGVRRFSSPRLPEITPLQNMSVNNKYQKIKERIFDSHRFHKVSWADVKSLWIHAFGNKSVIESTGSSHKKLVSPEGEVFFTFAHGDAMTYTHRTIKYIRDALRQVGLGE